MIKFGHARAHIKLKNQKGEVRRLSVTALQLHERKASPATFKKMTQLHVFACTFLQYFEKHLLPRTLMNDCLSKLLITGFGTAIPFALTPFWVCKLKRFLLFSINFFLLTTYCGFTVQKNKFHENFPRAIFN